MQYRFGFLGVKSQTANIEIFAVSFVAPRYAYLLVKDEDFPRVLSSDNTQHLFFKGQNVDFEIWG